MVDSLSAKLHILFLYVILPAISRQRGPSIQFFVSVFCSQSCTPPSLGFVSLAHTEHREILRQGHSFLDVGAPSFCAFVPLSGGLGVVTSPFVRPSIFHLSVTARMPIHPPLRVIHGNKSTKVHCLLKPQTAANENGYIE